MGLDGVELILAIEDHFGIEIPDRDAWELTTPRKLIDYIAKKLSIDSIAPATCLSQHAFHRLRSAITEVTGLPRKRIRPSTILEEILPEKTRIQNWTNIQKVLNASRWPTLARSPSLMGLLWIFCSTVFFVLLLLLCMKLSVKISFCLSIAITLIVAVILMRATKRSATYFEPVGYTVGDLARILVTDKPEESNQRAWSRAEIAVITRAIIMEQLGITEVDDDDRFVEDLGVD